MYPTELRLIGYLTESIWTAKSEIKHVDTRHVMDGTIFSTCSISAFSTQSAAPKRDVEKNATRNRRRDHCGKVEADVEPGLAFCGKLTCSAELECIESSGDTQSTQSARFESHSTKCREICRSRFHSKWRSVEFSSVGNRCKNERQCEETRCCRNEPGSEKPECARKLAAENSDINDDDSKWLNDYHTSLAGVPRLQKVYLELATTTRTKARRQNGRLRCEYVNMEKCLWLSLSKPQFILETILFRIYIQQKISHKEQ